MTNIRGSANESELRMNIAYLGWGSLIWKPGSASSLAIAGSWETDGPPLPIEFARVSGDGSLTIVLHPDVPNVQVLWARTLTQNIETALLDLKKRERTTNVDRIGFVCIPNSSKRCNVIPTIWQRIEQWAKQKGLDAVVWTDLSSNFKEKTGLDFSEENAVAYISSLSGEALAKAENYVRMAPEQVETNVRKRLKEELGWRSLEEYRAGFWLDRNTFIKADKVRMQTIGRKKVGDHLGRSENAQMLILTDAIEMIVDDKGKILGLDKHPKGLGLWLDTVNKAMKNQKMAEPQLSQ
jgi:hypothetical protein